MTGSPYTTDTSPEAERLQLELIGRMTPQQRVEKMWAMSHRARQMAFAAIARRHPEYDEREIRLAFIGLTYGRQLADDIRTATMGQP